MSAHMQLDASRVRTLQNGLNGVVCRHSQQDNMLPVTVLERAQHSILIKVSMRFPVAWTEPGRAVTHDGEPPTDISRLV